MIPFTPQLLFFLELLLFSTVILMHLVKKDSSIIFLYAAQSLVISSALFYSAIKESAPILLIIVAIATFLVKVIMAPYFFSGLVKKYKLKFSANAYLSGPLTLVVLALITAFAYSNFFRELAFLSPNNENSLLLVIAMMFISTFLVVNRRGILFQMVGTLSLENAIVSFAYVTGLETTPGPQLGILFDIVLWILIATVFASMIYQHFGSLDASIMKNLKEE